MELLLFSNSRQAGEGWMDYLEPMLKDFFSPEMKLCFIPFALPDEQWYGGEVAKRFEEMGLSITPLYSSEVSASDIEGYDGVFIGGGNTFRLCTKMHETGLLEAVRDRAKNGLMKYMGISAGSNMACPTIMTTNDMPICYPPSFDALDLLSYQINAHYFDKDPASTHMGETREDRLHQFHKMNNTPVLGLREGSWIHYVEGVSTLHGQPGAKLFLKDQKEQELPAGTHIETLFV